MLIVLSKPTDVNCTKSVNECECEENLTNEYPYEMQNEMSRALTEFNRCHCIHMYRYGAGLFVKKC